jgi:hypothetical protein
MSQEQTHLTCLLVGDTGVGKSEFGNRYLNDSVFPTGESPDPVTLEPQIHSASINGVIRQVIDTEGHNDGNSISSQQIQRLAARLNDWEQGVNGIVVVLVGPNGRLSQGVRDILRWLYNTFANPEVLNHISVVFTFCQEGNPTPDRRRRETEFRPRVQQFLMEIAGVETPPPIPIFFVDSKDFQGVETERNIGQFHDWLARQSPLSTHEIRTAPLRETIEDEIETRVFQTYRYDGQPRDQYRFGVYVDQTRQKVTPNNGDPPRYGDWTVIRTWEEPAGHQTVQTKSVEHMIEERRVCHHGPQSLLGMSSGNHTHWNEYRITWIEQWTVTTSFDGEITSTQPVQIGNRSEQETGHGKEKGHTPGWTRKVH